MNRTRETNTLAVTKAELGSLMHVAAAIHHRIGLKLHRLPGGIRMPGSYDAVEHDEAGAEIGTPIVIDVIDHVGGHALRCDRAY